MGAFDGNCSQPKMSRRQCLVFRTVAFDFSLFTPLPPAMLSRMFSTNSSKFFLPDLAPARNRLFCHISLSFIECFINRINTAVGGRYFMSKLYERIYSATRFIDNKNRTFYQYKFQIYIFYNPEF